MSERLSYHPWADTFDVPAHKTEPASVYEMSESSPADLPCDGWVWYDESAAQGVRTTPERQFNV
jgi:hypothetical protein